MSLDLDQTLKLSYMHNHEFLFPLLISVICLTASQIIFIDTIKLLFNRKVVILTAIFITCNPAFIYFAWNGLESSLFLLVLNLYLNQVIKIKGTDIKDFLLLGLIAGMLFLARTDSFFIIALTMLYFLITQDNGKTKKENSAFVILWGIVSIIVASPWLIFNYFKYGNLIQDSASSASIILLRELLIGYEAEFSTYIRLVMLDIGRYIKFIIPDYFGYPYILLIFLLLFGLYFSITNKEKRVKWFIAIYYIFFAYTILLHSIRIYPRAYYLPPFIDLIILTLAILINSVISNRLIIRTPKYETVLLIILTILFITIPIYSTHTSILEGPDDLASAGYNILNQNITPLLQKENQHLLGTSDSGLYSWFWNGTVVNLDGLVNHKAFIHVKKGDMISFLREYHIRYFYIRPAWMNEWYMGNGSGLWYISFPVIPSKTEQNKTTKNEREVQWPRDHFEMQKLLKDNFEITSYYYNSTIMPYDKNISHYLGYGWKIPYLQKYRVGDLLDTYWFPFTSHYSNSSEYATSKGPRSNIYLPLKLNETYRISLALNTTQNINTLKTIMIDNQTGITAPISYDISNITLNVTATQDVTHVIMTDPDDEQETSSVNLWGIYITNLSDTTTHYQ